MKKRLQNWTSISITFALAVGLAGTSCSRAKHPTASAATSTPGLVGNSESLSRNVAAAIPPNELAKKELQNSALEAKPEHQVQANVPTQKMEPAQAKPEGPKCYVETFHHAPSADDTTEETSSHHGNLMILAHAHVNTAHLCVRVNGIPVGFDHHSDRKGDQILIGSVAAPSAKITVSYCVGKKVCPEVSQANCTIPKDEFMDALGGSADDSADGQWANDDAKLNADVKKELSEIDGAAGDAGDSGNARKPASIQIFKGWIEEHDASACGQTS